MKKLYSLLFLLFSVFNLQAQDDISWDIDGTFVEGISPVYNTFTAWEYPGSAKAVFFLTNTNNQLIDTYTDDYVNDGYTWEIDMGAVPNDAYELFVLYRDVNDGNLEYSNNSYVFDILPMPAWRVVGTADDVIVNGTEISFHGTYPIYELPYTIPSSVKGIGDRSLNIAGYFVFDGVYDFTNQNTSADNNYVQINLNILDQLPTYTQYVDFTSTCTLESDLNLTFTISESISTPEIALNIPKLKFPIAPTVTLKVDAGVSLYATLLGQVVIGQDVNTLEWGFIEDGNGQTTKVIGVLTGNGFIRGEVSVLFGAASVNASLKARARLGAGFSYVSPSDLTPLIGGDINVYGEACYETFWGLGPGDCKISDSFYYGMFGDTNALRNSTNPLENLFNTQSVTFRDTGTLVLPDFSPQPSFATQGDMLYAVWREHIENEGYLLFSKLSPDGTEFSDELIVVNNANSISNPKVGILPSGSAIITWSQSRYDESTLPLNANDEDMLQAQDVWFAIYDNTLDSIVFTEPLSDDNSNPQSGRAEGEANIFIGDNSEAMITWISSDINTQTSEIWYARLTETLDEWNISEIDVLSTLQGINSNVNIVYADSVNALAVWVNDPDSDEETYDNEIIFSEWDGTSWSAEAALTANDGYTDFKQLSVSANLGYIAAAWTSSYFYNDNDFVNSIELEVYDAITQEWLTNSYFEDNDSLYYFQNPRVSISDNGIASICYQVIEMFPDTMFIDNGELYLYVKDLPNNSAWSEITENTFLCDTNTYIWQLSTGFAADDRYYIMTQEYNDNGEVLDPEYGILFGNPSLSMVLRGLQVNPNLTVQDIDEPTEVPVGVEELSQKQNFKLLQNYPNPFSSYTTIEFHLQQSSDVSLEIYSMTGVKVSQLLNSHLAAGIYKTQFYSGDLPSGIYVCKFSVDGNTSSLKIMISK